MPNKIFKISFHIIIFSIALFFLSFFVGIISVEDIISIFNLDTKSNSGMAVKNIFSELKLVTSNFFGLIFQII
jgi:hypothetical protein